MIKNKFTFIDLFAGIGGFRTALTNLGGECVGFSEIDKVAIQTYCENYNEPIEKNLGDITQLKDLPKHDILTAGVPCQSWSIAGKNLGFEDDRGQLWNDTIYLLNKSRPKAFIFENVKGLVDPRNAESFEYILNRIKEAGYFANHYVVNSSDYGVPQARSRVYIIGFEKEKYLKKFKLPEKITPSHLFEYLDNKEDFENIDKTLFNNKNENPNSLSANSGFNDYFLFNDLRGGDTTIHSWDIIETTKKQKEICEYLLKNRRKKKYGPLDGNPLSLENFKELNHDICQEDLDELVELKIFIKEDYSFVLNKTDLKDEEKDFINIINSEKFIIDDIKNKKEFKIKNINVKKMIENLCLKKIITCTEQRYDFKNTKISTGLFGINRIVLPNAHVFPTLVASDSNDYIATKMIYGENIEEYKMNFLNEIYKKGNYRKISKTEACRIQGFPSDFILPEKRNKWMKLIGNSVSVPVIEKISNLVLGG